MQYLNIQSLFLFFFNVKYVFIRLFKLGGFSFISECTVWRIRLKYFRRTIKFNIRRVERRPVDSVVRRVDQMERRQTIRGRGRPKKTIREVIKKDLEINGLNQSMVLDRTLWRKLIHVADPT